MSPAAPRSRKNLQCRAGNLLLELVGSGVGAAAVTAVTTFTSENRDAEIDRLQVRDSLHPPLLRHSAWGELPSGLQYS